MPDPKLVDVVVAGDANVDLLLKNVPPLEPGKEKLAQSMELALGGSSAITALVLANLGVKVAFAGVVGEDQFGRFVERKLRAAGVGVAHLHRRRGIKTGVTVWVSQGSKRAGVTYAGSNEQFEVADVTGSMLAKTRHLHVGAYFLLRGFQPGAAALFQRAHRSGLTTSLDCNWDPSERWDSGVGDVLRATDVFFPNEDEARRLACTNSVRVAAKTLAHLARVVVVKRGSRGALVASAGRTLEAPAVRVREVNATGAGDSFNAGFLARYVRGASLEECLRAGVETGARAVSHGGVAAFS